MLQSQVCWLHSQYLSLSLVLRLQRCCYRSGLVMNWDMSCLCKWGLKELIMGYFDSFLEGIGLLYLVLIVSSLVCSESKSS
jgi:hypothetical protein